MSPAEACSGILCQHRYTDPVLHPHPSTPIRAHCRGNQGREQVYCLCRWRMPMTHNSRNPPAKGQAIRLGLLTRAQGRALGALAELTPPRHHHPAPTRSPWQTARRCPAWSGLGSMHTYGPGGTPGGPGPGHKSEAPKQGQALCGRRAVGQTASPWAPPGRSLPLRCP